MARRRMAGNDPAWGDAMRPYPKLTSGTLDELVKVFRQITQLRRDDIGDFDNLVNIFVSGRKVGKVPTSSTDVATTDREGDMNWDANYFYLAVVSAGVVRWRRIALSTW